MHVPQLNRHIWVSYSCFRKWRAFCFFYTAKLLEHKQQSAHGKWNLWRHKWIVLPTRASCRWLMFTYPTTHTHTVRQRKAFSQVPFIAAVVLANRTPLAFIRWSESHAENVGTQKAAWFLEPFCLPANMHKLWSTTTKEKMTNGKEESQDIRGN